MKQGSISTSSLCRFIDVLSVQCKSISTKEGAAEVHGRLTRAVSLLRFMKLSSCSLRFKAWVTCPNLLSPLGQKMTLNLKHKTFTW